MKIKNKVIYTICFFIMTMLPILVLTEKTAYGETVQTNVVYTPGNPASDPWKGGSLVLNTDISVKRNRIIYNPILSRTVDFSIKISVPENISADKFLAALKNNSTLRLGNQTVQLSRNNFTQSGNDVIYTFEKSSFNLVALLDYLISLLDGSETRITMNLELDVNTLASNNSFDTSQNNLLTTGKLPPSPTNSLQFKTEFYDRRKALIFTSNSAATTWNNYISPWNGIQANSAGNGKADDTQKSGSTREVLGINRVLNGTNYASRVVNLPIKDVINPVAYMRTVNFFSKTALLEAKNQNLNQRVVVSEQRDVNAANLPRFTRKTTYTFFGRDNNGIPLSPISMDFYQQTVVDLKLDQNSITTVSNTDMKVTGEFYSEGRTNTFYIKGTDGAEKIINARGIGNNKIELTLPGYPNGGTYPIIVGIRNEYGIKKEVPVTVTVKNEEVKLLGISPEINFGTNKIPEPGAKLMNQLPFAIRVSDTYATVKPWKIYMNMSQPFATAQGEKLPGKLYTESGQVVGVDNILIYQNEAPGQGEFTPINLGENKGFYLQMDSSNVKVNADYVATLNFVLERGPS